MWMFKQDSLITALEIGTSKVVAIVAELNESEALNIIGFGQAPSQGVIKGQIVDRKLAYEAIRQAVKAAELKSDL